MQIDNLVRVYRHAAALTQEELAARCQVSRQTIIALEKGNYEPSLGLALRIASTLSVGVDELFKLKGAPH